MNIVEIGANIKPQAHVIPYWKEARVLTVDIDPKQNPDIVADASNLYMALPEELRGKLDGVFASHVLEHFSYWDTERVLTNWKDCLREGGELHVVVPSWEWAAREVLSEKPSPALLGHSFAGQVNTWDVHLCMFTMRNLRRIFEKIGLSVIRARTGEYSLAIGHPDNIHKAEQHYIVGVNGTPELKKE